MTHDQSRLTVRTSIVTVTKPSRRYEAFLIGSVGQVTVLIAMGFKLYGFGAEVARIAHDTSMAATHFLLNQLPELYTAFARDETTFPVQYIGANVPQAWAAGSAFMLTQALLGFLPNAPRNKLYVDPSLPVWLPDLTVQDLHVGKHKLDIRFWREGEQTAFEVIKGDTKLVERCDIVSKVARLRTASDPISNPHCPCGGSRLQSRSLSEGLMLDTVSQRPGQ